MPNAQCLFTDYQFSMAFLENLTMLMLINTVIQNFDSWEFQVNGHHRFKQRRQTT
ncbi:hypothetical protein [Nostoc sp.]|uniref:hypothetical protein n=1 Tax=Nostoc sp. TaxID=1180 RepID=UPI002FFB7411